MTISFLSLLTIVFACLAFMIGSEWHRYCALADQISFSFLFLSVLAFHIYYYNVISRVKHRKSTEMEHLDCLYQLSLSKNITSKHVQVLTMKNLLSSRTSLHQNTSNYSPNHHPHFYSGLMSHMGGGHGAGRHPSSLNLVHNQLEAKYWKHQISEFDA